MTARIAGLHDPNMHHSKGKRCFLSPIEELVLHKVPKLPPSRSGPRIFLQESAIRSIDCNCASDGIRWNAGRQQVVQKAVGLKRCPAYSGKFKSLSMSLPEAHQSYPAVVRYGPLSIQKIHQVIRHAYLFDIQSQ